MECVHEQLYRKARALQHKQNTTYQSIVRAYLIASKAGSYKAIEWVKAQAPSHLKPNSIYDRPEGFAADMNGSTSRRLYFLMERLLLD
ncbi:hypothetical protein D8Y20_12005 [Mariprofundus sp. EBB-1]|nr:hypothetical protein D8Y20_12005 [Mariprofundus sp. EBB-1]